MNYKANIICKLSEGHHLTKEHIKVLTVKELGQIVVFVVKLVYYVVYVLASKVILANIDSILALSQT